METQEKNPLLTKAFQLDHGKTRRLPVEFAGSTWDDDIISFREALINVERYVFLLYILLNSITIY